MSKAPTDPRDAVRFIEEVPYRTAKKHGKKYRLMYQIYTHPNILNMERNFLRALMNDIQSMQSNWSLKSAYPTPL